MHTAYSLSTIRIVFRMGRCKGSESLCDYLLDQNNTLVEASLKNSEFIDIAKQAEILAQNVIVVHLTFPSSKVERMVLDSKYTFSDKISAFGGTFGVWAELTGFSFLGILNIFLIVLKLFFGRFSNQK